MGIMSSKDETDDFMKKVQDAFQFDLKQHSEHQRKLFEDANTIMYNIALFSGAFATGSLILVSSEYIRIDQNQIITGVVILLIVVISVFFYLFHYHGKATNNQKILEIKLISEADLLVKYADLKDGNITYEEFYRILNSKLENQKKIIKKEF